MHLTSDRTSLEVTVRENQVWQTPCGKAAPGLCLQPLGWMVIMKANDSRMSPSGEAWLELELDQAQRRQEKLFSWHDAVIRDKILLKASRSTHDFHNFLGVKRELRMENPQWHKNTKWESVFFSTIHSSLFWIVLSGEAGEAHQSVVLSQGWEAEGGWGGRRGRARAVGSAPQWPALFFLLVEMGIGGTTLALVSRKQVTSRGQRG